MGQRTSHTRRHDVPAARPATGARVTHATHSLTLIIPCSTSGTLTGSSRRPLPLLPSALPPYDVYYRYVHLRHTVAMTRVLPAHLEVLGAARRGLSHTRHSQCAPASPSAPRTVKLYHNTLCTIVVHSTLRHVSCLLTWKSSGYLLIFSSSSSSTSSSPSGSSPAPSPPA